MMSPVRQIFPHKGTTALLVLRSRIDRQAARKIALKPLLEELEERRWIRII